MEYSVHTGTPLSKRMTGQHIAIGTGRKHKSPENNEIPDIKIAPV